MIVLLLFHYLNWIENHDSELIFIFDYINKIQIRFSNKTGNVAASLELCNFSLFSPGVESAFCTLLATSPSFCHFIFELYIQFWIAIEMALHVPKAPGFSQMMKEGSRVRLLFASH